MVCVSRISSDLTFDVTALCSHVRLKVLLHSENAIFPKELIGNLEFPQGKTTTDYLADLLGYLFRCASDYIRESHGNGSELWESVKHNIDFVFCYPSGWDYAQKVFRDAVILAGLARSNSDAEQRLCFVTDAEASLCFCFKTDPTRNLLKASPPPELAVYFLTDVLSRQIKGSWLLTSVG